ncbi:MAG: hypothetical protein WC645_02235 [Candidatus Margulisiibacteriota bacterium]
MEYLITSAVLSLLFGMLFLLSPEILGRLGEIGNRTIMVLDEKLTNLHLVTGLALLILGGFIIWAILPYGALWYLHSIGLISLFFGFLYLAAPKGLKTLSTIFNVVLLSTDEVVLAVRKTAGITLLVAGIYILYSIYYLGAK